MDARSLARIARAALVGGALLLSFAAGAPATAEDAPPAVQFPKGMRIGLVPPHGLTPSDTFNGFANAEEKVAIAVAELPPQAYYAVEHELFSQEGNQGNQAITVEGRELFPFADGVGFLATGHVDLGGAAFRKWVLVTGGADFTGLVQAQVPETARSRYPDAAIRAALASVTFRPTPIDEQLAMLPFRLGDLAGFHVQRAMPEGAVVLADESPPDGAADQSHVADQPHVMVMVGRGQPELPSEHQQFAQRLVETIPGLTDMRLTGSEPMRIGGRPGFEVRAQARDPATGAPLKLIQWLRFGGGGFLRVLGVATDQGWPQAYPRFRAVRDGVETR